MRSIAVALSLWLAAAALAAGPAHPRPLSARQIVEKNVAARGGLEAWRKIETMVWSGHMQTGSAPAGMPFVLQLKRPNKTRFELTAMGRKSERIFDGEHGWTVRPGASGTLSARAYTPPELQFAKDAPGIDGPLIDYQAKGSTVALEGVEAVEGRKAFRLSVQFASGERHRVWIDAETFLDVRYDRTSYSAAGVAGTVSVLYRDYQDVDGLKIPSTIEIGAGSGKATDRMVIERIALNPPLDDRLFARPVSHTWHHEGGSTAAAWSPPDRPVAALPPQPVTTPAPEVVPR